MAAQVRLKGDEAAPGQPRLVAGVAAGRGINIWRDIAVYKNHGRIAVLRPGSERHGEQAVDLQAFGQVGGDVLPVIGAIGQG